MHEPTDSQHHELSELRLPTPNEDEVRRFRDLCEKRFGTRPDEAEARCVATSLVRLVYLAERAQQRAK